MREQRALIAAALEVEMMQAVGRDCVLAFTAKARCWPSRAACSLPFQSEDRTLHG